MAGTERLSSAGNGPVAFTLGEQYRKDRTYIKATAGEAGERWLKGGSSTLDSEFLITFLGNRLA